MSTEPDRHMDFPLDSLLPTLRRLASQQVPHAERLLRQIEESPNLRWADLPRGDQAIIQGWSLHLVGMLNRLNSHLQRVKSVVFEASRLEKDNPCLSPSDFIRLAEHHSQQGLPERANAFRLAAALRTPAPKSSG